MCKLVLLNSIIYISPLSLRYIIVKIALYRNEDITNV